MGRNNLNIDQAMRNAYIKRYTNISQKQLEEKSLSKHGGFDAFFVRRDGAAAARAGPSAAQTLDVNKKTNEVQKTIKQAMNRTVTGFIHGDHSRNCAERHAHSRACSKNRNLDLAELQSKAFKYLILQKPRIGSMAATLPGNGANYRASFFPNDIMPEELQRAF